MITLTGTLVYPVSTDRKQVLLGEKLKKIGAGCLNGWGGKCDENEGLRQCACREFYEETGGVVISKDDLEKIGIVHFKNYTATDRVFVFTVHVYIITRSLSDSIRDTDEMSSARWCDIVDLKNQVLMPADYFWLPRMLSGESGIAWAEYGPDQQNLLSPVHFERVEIAQEE